MQKFTRNLLLSKETGLSCRLRRRQFMILVCELYFPLSCKFLDYRIIANHFHKVLVGKIVGFEKEAAVAARQAGDFLKQCRELQA
jgi:hypothetical protein